MKWTDPGLVYPRDNGAALKEVYYLPWTTRGVSMEREKRTVYDSCGVEREGKRGEKGSDRFL